MIYTDITSRALMNLTKRPGLHIDMTEALYRGLAEVLYAEADGVLQLVRRDRDGKPVLYQISADTPETAARLAIQLELRIPVVTHQPASREAAVARWEGSTVSCWTQALWPGFEPPPPDPSVEIWPLDLGDLPVVTEHYHLIQDSEELAERISSGNLYGACVEDQVAGFVGVHTEGAVGMLTVLEEYRGRGIGRALLTYIIRRELRRGHIPYSQILQGNQVSLTLQKKAGLEPQLEPIWWVMPEGSGENS